MAAKNKKSALATLSTSGKVGLGALMLILPLAAYYLVLHSELETEIESAQNTHRQLQFDLKAAESAARAYQNDLEELRQREKNKERLMKILPATTEYPAFLSSVQNVANLVGVQLQAWTPRAEVPEEFYSRVPMQLELQGKYHQLAKFFYNVGQLERIINMEDIQIAEPEEQDGEVRLNVEVLATAFHTGDSELAANRGPKGRRDPGRK